MISMIGSPNHENDFPIFVPLDGNQKNFTHFYVIVKEKKKKINFTNFIWLNYAYWQSIQELHYFWLFN